MDMWTLCRNKITLEELKTAKGDINIKNDSGDTPFNYICFYSGSNGFNMKILRYCCEVMKADINIKNNDGSTPFHYICENSNSNGFNMKMLRYCCEVMKADMNVKNIYRTTPFYYLCKLNNHKILKYLGKNNLLTNETIKNSELTIKTKLRYFTEGILVNLCDPEYLLY